MNLIGPKGNNPQAWDKLLAVLDDKLQLGLLEHLRRVHTYHIEDQVLAIQAGNLNDQEYLLRDPVFHQLELLAQDAIKVEKLKIVKIS